MILIEKRNRWDFLTTVTMIGMTNGSRLPDRSYLGGSPETTNKGLSISQGHVRKNARILLLDEMKCVHSIIWIVNNVTKDKSK